MPRPTSSILPLIALLALAGCGDFIPPALIDGRGKATDIIRLLAAQRSDQVGGGNPTLGSAATLAAGGKPTGQVRFTAVRREMPQLSGVPIAVGSGQSATIPTVGETAISVSADGAVPFLKGFGSHHFLGVDLLGSIAFLSGYSASELDLSGGDVAYGVGFRLGLLEEGPTLPAVSGTVMYRGLPGLSVAREGLATSDGTFAFDAAELSLHSFGVRLAASKQWGRLGATVGVGFDDVEVSGDLHTTLRNRPSGGPSESHTSPLSGSLSRRTLYGGLSYRLGGLTVAGEVGHISGGGDRYESNNQFAAGWGRNFLNLGVRVGS
jgi:hypothetical protein